MTPPRSALTARRLNASQPQRRHLTTCFIRCAKVTPVELGAKIFGWTSGTTWTICFPWIISTIDIELNWKTFWTCFQQNPTYDRRWDVDSCWCMLLPPNSFGENPYPLIRPSAFRSKECDQTSEEGQLWWLLMAETLWALRAHFHDMVADGSDVLV